MFQTTTTKSSLSDPLTHRPQNNYAQTFKLEGSPSSHSASYSSDKISQTHQNPIFRDYDDDIYQSTKKLKSYGNEYNMLPNTIQPNQMVSYPSGNPELDLNYLKLQNILPYQNPAFNSFNLAPSLQIPVNQPVNNQYANLALFQSLYNNALVEAETMRRYNEAQELIRLQNLSNSLMPGNLNNLMLLSMYEKQKKDYYNFYLLQEAQQQLNNALMNKSSLQNMSQISDAKMTYEKQNQGVVMIPDEDEQDEAVTRSTTLENMTSQAYGLAEKFSENVMVEKGTDLNQENFTQNLNEKYVKNETDLKKKERSVHGIRIGSPYQTEIRPYTLNHGKRKVSRVIKPIWKPDVTDEAELERSFSAMEKTVGDKIMNQENAAKLLARFGMNLEAVKNEIKKNIAFYRNYFKASPRVLRARQT